MNINTENDIFQIPEWNIQLLNKRINQLNKRAVKLNVPQISIITHGTDLIPDPTFDTSNLPSDLESKVPKIKVYNISLDVNCIKLAGYTFVGTLDHTILPGQVIVKTVPGQYVPERFFNSKPICNHCNKIRNRHETFVLQHEEGHHLQVGRQCLKDFLGHDPSQILRLLSSLKKLINSFDPDEEFWGGGFCGSGRRNWTFSHEEVLEVTAAVIRTYGWVPRSSADPMDGRTATADIVIEILLPPTNEHVAQERKKIIESLKWNKKIDKEESKKAVEWLKEQTPNSEYIHNLQTIANSDGVPVSMFGFWCSLIASFQRFQERLRLNEAQKKTNEWLGKEKDKIEITIKLINIQYIESFYGTVALHKMLDDNGRTVVWFANCDSKMVKGKKYTIKGTIKKLDKYNDWKQTILTRVKVVKEVETNNE